MTAPGGRVLGWDLLRGACALMVAFYHLSYWLGLVELPALGTYGVYLFFVLSGASLAYCYPAERVRGWLPVAHFLATRWLRLAPLYLLLCLVYLALLAPFGNLTPDDALHRLLLNASFAFGLSDPATAAILIGGWSLGIEFLYYLAFPLVALLLPRRPLAWAAWLALAVLQWAWILGTIGSEGWMASVARYHQAPAFAAYFFGGCMLGYWQRQQLPDARASLAWFACGACVLLLVALSPAVAGDELLGARGAVLFLACFAAVHLAGRARLSGSSAALARWAGDITYGTYLLHPILFFGFSWYGARALTGAEPAQWPLAARWLLLALVLAGAVLLAIASERWLERPLRNWGRRKLRGGAAAQPQSEVASISS